MSTKYNFRNIKPHEDFNFKNLENICSESSLLNAIEDSMSIKPLQKIVSDYKVNDTKLWYIDKNINKDFYPFQFYINQIKTGFAITHDLINNDKKFIVIHVICSSKENRLKGTGRILMTQIIDFAKENNYNGILIHEPSLSGIIMYTKYGFIKDTDCNVIRYPCSFIQHFPFTKFYDHSSPPTIEQSGGKIKIMGRLRNIILNGRTKYVKFKGELRKLSELRKDEKILEKSSS